MWHLKTAAAHCRSLQQCSPRHVLLGLSVSDCDSVAAALFSDLLLAALSSQIMLPSQVRRIYNSNPGTWCKLVNVWFSPLFVTHPLQCNEKLTTRLGL